MNAFGAAKPTANALYESMSTSMTRFRNADDAVSTRLPHFLSCHAKAEGVLRDALRRNDGQVLASSAMLDSQFEHSTRSSSNERVRLRAWRPTRPSNPGLEAWPPAGRERAVIDLVGRTGAESRVRTFGVVPGDVVIELARERGAGQGHDGQQARALALQGTIEALDDGEDNGEGRLWTDPASPNLEAEGPHAYGADAGERATNLQSIPITSENRR